MKKNKVLAVVIACVAVIITALVITMAATGKFASLKKHFSDETTTSAPADETTAVQANARPKTAKPAQLVAALMSASAAFLQHTKRIREPFSEVCR